MRGQVTTAGRLKKGDRFIHVVNGDNGETTMTLKVRATRKSPGRKPKKGENMVIVTAGGEIKTNTIKPVRVIR